MYIQLFTVLINTMDLKKGKVCILYIIIFGGIQNITAKEAAVSTVVEDDFLKCLALTASTSTLPLSCIYNLSLFNLIPPLHSNAS